MVPLSITVSVAGNMADGVRIVVCDVLCFLYFVYDFIIIIIKQSTYLASFPR